MRQAVTAGSVLAVRAKAQREERPQLRRLSGGRGQQRNAEDASAWDGNALAKRQPFDDADPEGNPGAETDSAKPDSRVQRVVRPGEAARHPL